MATKINLGVVPCDDGSGGTYHAHAWYTTTDSGKITDAYWEPISDNPDHKHGHLNVSNGWSCDADKESSGHDGKKK